jgi:transposase
VADLSLMGKPLWRTAHPGDPLRQWSDAVAERRGNRVAVIALARRMAGVLWAMWRDGHVYDPAPLAKIQAQGVRRAAQTLEFQAAALERAARKRHFGRRSVCSSSPEVTTN